jgi:hypothetical protein
MLKLIEIPKQKKKQIQKKKTKTKKTKNKKLHPTILPSTDPLYYSLHVDTLLNFSTISNIILLSQYLNFCRKQTTQQLIFQQMVLGSAEVQGTLLHSASSLPLQALMVPTNCHHNLNFEVNL